MINFEGALGSNERYPYAEGLAFTEYDGTIVDSPDHRFVLDNPVHGIKIWADGPEALSMGVQMIHDAKLELQKLRTASMISETAGSALEALAVERGFDIVPAEETANTVQAAVQEIVFTAPELMALLESKGVTSVTFRPEIMN